MVSWHAVKVVSTLAMMRLHTALLLLSCGLTFLCANPAPHLLALNGKAENQTLELGAIGKRDLHIHFYVQLLQQQSPEQQQEPLNDSTAGFDDNLVALVRQEFNGNWQRTGELLAVVEHTRSINLKRSIYLALWQELKNGQYIYNPFHLSEFYANATKESCLSAEFRKEILQKFIARSAQILEAPFHATERMNFPLVANLLQHLTQLGQAVFSEIMSAVYDAISLLEPPLNIAARLSNFSTNTEQLAVANLILLDRSEIQDSVAAREQLVENLKYLLSQRGFWELPNELRAQVYAHLPSVMRTLYTAQKVCLRNATVKAYIYECPHTYLICSNVPDPKKAAFYVLRTLNETGDQFAFYSAYWRNRYIKLETSSSPEVTYGILKNVYSSEEIAHWQARFYGNLVALYTKGKVLCGGNATYWDGDEHHVYTRRLAQFEQYRDECLWQLDDCSDGANQSI